MLSQYVEHVSVSALQKYERCPQAWYLRYIEKHPEESGEAAEVGKLAHTVIEQAIRQGVAGNPEAVELFLSDLKEGLHLSEEEYSEFSSYLNKYENRITEVIEWTLEALAIVDNYRDDSFFTELEFRVPLPFDSNLHLKGFIDFVTSTTIIDWKTGRNVDSAVSSNQLPLYAWAVGQRLNLPAEEFSRKYAFLPIYQQYEDNKSIDDALAWVERIVSQINENLEGLEYFGKGVFATKPGKACRWCSYMNLCSDAPVTTPNEITSLSQAKAVAERILRLEAELDSCEQLLAKYCKDGTVVELNGEYFGYYPGSVRRSWDKAQIWEAISTLPSADAIQAINIDARGIDKLAKKYENIDFVIGTALTVSQDSAKFKHSDKPPK